MTQKETRQTPTLFSAGEAGTVRSVCDALSDKITRVTTHERVDAKKLEDDGIYAVFDADTEAFVGLVTCADVARIPGRIFADLVPVPRPAPVIAEAELEEVAERLTSERRIALPVLKEGEFLGAVTRESLLRALLRRERDQAQSLTAQVARYHALVEQTPEIAVHEEQTTKQLQLAAKVFESASEGIIITDAKSRILAVNTAFSTVTGYRPEEVMGKTPSVLKSGKQDEAFYAAMWEALRRNGQWQGEIWNRRKNGDIYPEWLKVSAVTDPDGSITHYIGIFYDITVQKKVLDRINRLSNFDPLTGLPNRLALRSDLNSIAFARTMMKDTQSAVLFIDLDHFKEINDSLGHSLGDRVLQIISQRLSSCTRGGAGGRSEDVVGRLGGDEFLLILKDTGSEDEVKTVAEHMLDALSQPLSLEEGRHLLITASIGIAMYPGDAGDVDELIRKADIAMYQAKSMGRRRYSFYSPQMGENVHKKFMLRRDLHRAFEHGELMLVYQPQFNLQTGRIVGAEALLRWQHPEHGMLPPESFLDILEETGLSIAVGEWVLRTAVRQCQQWQGVTDNSFRIAVNVSPTQLYDGHFVNTVQQIESDTGFTLGRLELEITEKIAMRDVDQAFAILKRLGAMGVRISLDDFGTGYSSLNYVRKFDINALKIDQSFLHGALTHNKDLAVIRSIINLAHNLGFEVVAEGVETETHARVLRELGCDHAQGFLFGAPVASDHLEAMLRSVPSGLVQ